MASKDHPEIDKQFVASVAKAIQILSAFRHATPLLGNQELATRCGLPKSTVSRFTYTLTKLDCLEFDSRFEKYRLGARIAALGHAMVAGYDVAERLQPFMQRLSEDHNCLVTLGAYEDGTIICLASAQGTGSRAPRVEPGMRVPTFSTAMGRAYLASCGHLEQQRLLAQATKRKPQDAEAMAKTLSGALSEYGKRGYCTTIEGWRKGQNGIAVPLFLKSYGRRLLLGCGGPSVDVTPERVFGTLSQGALAIANEIEVMFERQSRSGRPRRTTAR
jgi:DNA-binding IclR family transcriptional regulator